MEDRESQVERLITDCIIAHQEYILVKLILELENEYKELAKLATMGEYKDGWTHKQVLDYITFET